MQNQWVQSRTSRIRWPVIQKPRNPEFQESSDIPWASQLASQWASEPERVSPQVSEPEAGEQNTDVNYTLHKWEVCL